MFEDIQNLTPYRVKMMDGQYLHDHLRDLDGLLGYHDARAVLWERNQRGWQDGLHVRACVLYRPNDPGETPVALAIATKRDYRDGVRRATELD